MWRYGKALHDTTTNGDISLPFAIANKKTGVGRPELDEELGLLLVFAYHRLACILNPSSLLCLR